MHDPDVVLFDLHLPIPRRKYATGDWGPRWRFRVRRRTNDENLGERIYPWWRPAGYDTHLAGRVYGLASLATVCHHEPDDRDSGDVCGRYPYRLGERTRWAWDHRSHLWMQWTFPGTGLWRWWSTRCDHCGQRFGRKEDRIGEWYGDRVWHQTCRDSERLRRGMERR